MQKTLQNKKWILFSALNFLSPSNRMWITSEFNEYEKWLRNDIHFRWLYKSLTFMCWMLVHIRRLVNIFMSNFTFYLDAIGNGMCHTHENVLRHDTLWWLCDNIHTLICAMMHMCGGSVSLNESIIRGLCVMICAKKWKLFHLIGGIERLFAIFMDSLSLWYNHTLDKFKMLDDDAGCKYLYVCCVLKPRL